MAAGTETASPEIASYLAKRREEVDAALERLLPGPDAWPSLLHRAIRHSVFAGGKRLRPILGSDISHWDVPDMTEPIAEAYELVERGVIGEQDFRELTFVNPVRLHAGANSEFFAGTVCEQAATTALAAEGA